MKKGEEEEGKSKNKERKSVDRNIEVNKKKDQNNGEILKVLRMRKIMKQYIQIIKLRPLN